MAGQSQGAVTKLAVDGNNMCFTSIDNKSTYQMINGNVKSICGRYRHIAARKSRGIITPKLHIKMQPTPQELDILLPMLGFSETTDVFTPVEDYSSLTNFDVELDYGPSVHTYTNGIPDKVILRAAKAVPWELEIQVFFDSIEVDDGGTASGSAIAGSTTAYNLSGQSTLTLNSGTHQPQDFVSVIDYKTAVQHNNSFWPTSIVPTTRQVFVLPDTPYTSTEVALLSVFTGEADGVSPADAPAVTGYSGNIVFASGALSTTIAYDNLAPPELEPPSIMGKQEIRNRMWLQAFGTASNHEITITNDITA